MQSRLDGVYCRIGIHMNKNSPERHNLKRPSESHPVYILLEGSLFDDQPSATMTQPPTRTAPAPALLGKLPCTQPLIYDLC
jgi:hypothetical protein